MNKNLTLNIITGIIVGVIYHFFISDNADLIETLVFVLAFIALSTLFEVILKRRREKRESTAITAVTADQAEVNKLIDGIGGQTNIISASYEVSRVKVSLKDADLIDQDKLKSLELEGAFLSGDQLQVTVGKQAESVAQQINERIKSNN